MSNPLRSVFKLSAIYTGMQLVPAILSFLLVPFFTHFLTPEEYGTANLVTSACTFLLIFLRLGQLDAATKLFFENPNDANYRKRLFGTYVIQYLLLLIPFVPVCFVFIYFWKTWLFKEIELYPYVALGILSMIGNPLFDLYQGTLRIRGRARRYATQFLTKTLLQYALSIFFVLYLGHKAEGILGAAALSSLIFFIYTIWSFGKEVTWKLDPEIVKKSFSYGLPFVPSELSIWILNSMERVVLGMIGTISGVGLYSIGAALGNSMNLVTSGFNEAFGPYILSVVADKNKSEEERVRRLSVIGYTGFVVIGLFLALFCREIVAALTAEAYHESWKVVPFIVLANLLIVLARLFKTPILFHRRAGYFESIATLSAAGIHVGLQFLLIPKFGFIGIGLVNIGVNAFSIACYLFVSRKYQQFSWHLSAFLKIILVGVFSYLALMYATIDMTLWPSLSVRLAGLIVATGLLLKAAGAGTQDLRSVLTQMGSLLTRKPLPK